MPPEDASQSEIEVQVDPSQTYPEQEERSQAEAEPQEQAQPTDAEVAAQEATVAAEAARRDQSERDQKNEVRRIAAERDAALARAEAAENARINERSEADQAELRRLRDSQDPDERDQYIAKMRETERDDKISGTAAQRAAAAERAGLFRATVETSFADLTDEERQAAYNTYGARTGKTNLREHEAFDALLAAKVAKATAGAPTADVLKAKDDEIAALKNQIAGQQLNGAGGPPRTPAGSTSAGAYKSKEELDSARVRREITVAQYKELRRAFEEPVHRI